jgi:N-terminal domain on NACHT_NTPase and P-loop NTPases
MDPFTAIGLAGNIAQFIDFTCKLFAATHQIYTSKSGLKSDTECIETLTEDLQAFSLKLQTSLSQYIDTSAADTKLSQYIDTSAAKIKLSPLAQKCQQAADELLAVLATLKSKKSGSRWHGFRSALKHIWDQKRIDAMSDRLDSYRLELILQLQLLSRLVSIGF